jgi:hypothetical protein
MKKWMSILSVLLIVQLAVALAVNLTVEDYGAFETEEKLLALSDAELDGLLIQDGESSVVLSRRDGKWVLPDRGDFPAEQQAVTDLLDKLSTLEKGWPVATTGGAAQRFKVDEAAFERKLTLMSGEEQLAVLFVGTSPGFRKVHVRPAGEDAVYAASFNTWEAGASADDWIDKQVLVFEEKDVTLLEMPDFSLQREGEAHEVKELGKDEETSDEEARKLLRSLAGLRIESVLGLEANPELMQDAPEIEVKVSRKDGKDLTYRFFKPEEEADYVLKRSDLDHFLKISELTMKPIKEAVREKLVRKKTGSESSQENVEEASTVDAGTVEGREYPVE